jgi:DNA helicase-2/ATP-dependent DNA helicase PcrA
MYSSLSKSQRDIVFNKFGKFVVRACPGSGKTYCVAARMSRLISNWKNDYQGIATVSFTNVAWQEIEKKCEDEFGMKSSQFPHFLGTIDSFINKYIFLPHGHLILECKNRPILVGEPHGIWTGRTFSDSLFDNCSYQKDGTLYAINSNKMPPNWRSNTAISNAKKRLNKAGFVTQNDANYFAMKLLEKYPSIAKALVLRFPFLIVDEAQDTSEIHMHIIDLLITQGLNEVMLVGDPDQAIFEWNDARPDLLNQKYTEWTNSLILNESRRCSQLICNYTFNISSLNEPSSAVNKEVSGFTHRPKVLVYSNNLPQIVNDFLQECKEYDITISKDSVAVVYRSKNLINKITGITEVPYNRSPWKEQSNYTRDFAKGKFLYDIGEITLGFKIIEKALIKVTKGLSSCADEDVQKFIDKHGYLHFKLRVHQFINSLPLTNASLGAWVDAANAVITKFQLDIKRTGRHYTFQQLFLSTDLANSSEINYRLGTVHSVKGETFDATLLILKTKGIGSAYKTILNNNTPISSSEELRIAYVGMTRPRKILAIAVPNEENKLAWENRLNKIV